MAAPFDCQEFHELCMDYRGAMAGTYAKEAYERLQEYCNAQVAVAHGQTRYLMKAQEADYSLRMELLAALCEYMSQFGQALEAHGIPYGSAQIAADQQARAAISKAESTN